MPFSNSIKEKGTTDTPNNRRNLKIFTLRKRCQAQKFTYYDSIIMSSGKGKTIRTEVRFWLPEARCGQRDWLLRGTGTF